MVVLKAPLKNVRRGRLWHGCFIGGAEALPDCGRVYMPQSEPAAEQQEAAQTSAGAAQDCKLQLLKLPDSGTKLTAQPPEPGFLPQIVLRTHAEASAHIAAIHGLSVTRNLPRATSSGPSRSR